MFNKSISILGVVVFGMATLATDALAQTGLSRQWPATAAANTQAPSQRNEAAVAAERSSLQLRLAATAKNGVSISANRGVRTSSSTPGTNQNNSTDEVISNGYHAYPPSCLSDPLPSTTSGPVISLPVNLAEFDPNAHIVVTEGVTISVWRVACVSLTGQAESATLLRIQRQTAFEGDSTQYPLFPGIRMSQTSSGVGFDNPSGLDFIRNAVEPNTVISTVYADDPVVNSTTYVLEYIPDPAFNVQNYNNAFNLRFDNFFLSNNYFYTGVMPTYAPTNATYPAAFQPMPISGYQSGNWVDKATPSNENMLIQVYEIPNDPTRRAFLFTWVAYAANGLPLNLEGNAIYNLGDTTVSSPVVIVTTNGGQSLWGNVTFTFSDCNTSQFTYTNNSGQPGPSGSGARTWSRLLGLNINGIVCQ